MEKGRRDDGLGRTRCKVGNRRFRKIDMMGKTTWGENKTGRRAGGVFAQEHRYRALRFLYPTNLRVFCGNSGGYPCGYLAMRSFLFHEPSRTLA